MLKKSAFVVQALGAMPLDYKEQAEEQDETVLKLSGLKCSKISDAVASSDPRRGQGDVQGDHFQGEMLFHHKRLGSSHWML
jgi:hypothetical protein